jgi:predicted HTH domain antitoxin
VFAQDVIKLPLIVPKHPFYLKENTMNFIIPDNILSEAHLSIADVKREIALLFLKKNYVTLEQASTLADMNSLAFQQNLMTKNTMDEKWMREEKMIVLAHQEWERFLAIQENPPKPNNKLKQLMLRQPLIK